MKITEEITEENHLVLGDRGETMRNIWSVLGIEKDNCQEIITTSSQSRETGHTGDGPGRKCHHLQGRK